VVLLCCCVVHRAVERIKKVSSDAKELAVSNVQSHFDSVIGNDDWRNKANPNAMPTQSRISEEDILDSDNSAGGREQDTVEMVTFPSSSGEVSNPVTSVGDLPAADVERTSENQVKVGL
jgi:hypothetical protein